jgi:hypothetical protein
MTVAGLAIGTGIAAPVLLIVAASVHFAESPAARVAIAICAAQYPADRLEPTATEQGPPLAPSPSRILVTDQYVEGCSAKVTPGV